MRRETESYGPEMEWSTSTNAGELNPRTYTRDGTDMRFGPRRHANRGEASNTFKTLSKTQLTWCFLNGGLHSIRSP